jgi:Xaa-Pro dipeptidase
MSETATLGKSLHERLESARRALVEHTFDLVLATPGTNFRYLTGVNTGRMERLIAFGLPREGKPFLICPAFEEDNMRRELVDGDVLTWSENEDPFKLLASTIKQRVGTTPRVGLEPTTWFWTVEKLKGALSAVDFADGGPIFESMRIRKSEDEVDSMRRAADLADEAARRARMHLREGMTEMEAAQVLLELIRDEGQTHEPLVQFGSNSAKPHAMAGTRRLERNDMVLFDLGANIGGYLSDLTRMTCFGDATHEMKEVYRVVYDAQQAAIEKARPGVPCQDVDRAARRVITKAGYGPYFLHRTGHGLGMDIHEPPYLVEGNEQVLEPGHVITIEPGIYLQGRFGVRIEEDILITENGAELLSDRQPDLIEMP